MIYLLCIGLIVAELIRRSNKPEAISLWLYLFIIVIWPAIVFILWPYAFGKEIHNHWR